jgi:hypothetical protein
MHIKRPDHDGCDGMQFTSTAVANPRSTLYFPSNCFERGGAAPGDATVAANTRCTPRYWSKCFERADAATASKCFERAAYVKKFGQCRILILWQL